MLVGLGLWFKVVYSLSKALNMGGGFNDFILMPLNMQHVATVGERIPPSIGRYSLGFFAFRYVPQSLDLAMEINNSDALCNSLWHCPCLSSLVARHFSGEFTHGTMV